MSVGVKARACTLICRSYRDISALIFTMYASNYVQKSFSVLIASNHGPASQMAGDETPDIGDENTSHSATLGGNMQEPSQTQTRWSLMITSIGGGELCQPSAIPTMMGGDFHEMVAELIGVHCTFALLHGTNTIQSDIALFAQGVNDGDLCTLVELEEPADHDGVRQCDICLFERFCHYGYTFRGGEREAVTAVCELCGGKPAQLNRDQRRELAMRRMNSDICEQRLSCLPSGF